MIRRSDRFSYGKTVELEKTIRLKRGGSDRGCNERGDRFWGFRRRAIAVGMERAIAFEVLEGMRSRLKGKGDRVMTAE